MSQPNPLYVLNKRDAATVRLQQQRGYEDRLVSWFLNTMHLGAVLKELRQTSKDIAGDTCVTFAGFNSLCPTFPVTLGCDNLKHRKYPLHKDPKAVLPLWMKTFLELPFIQAYRKFYENLGQEADSQPVGLVFPRRGFARGLIVHNAGQHFVQPHSGCFYYYGGDSTSLVVQPFVNFVHYVCDREGLGWTPTIE